jgi:hypothetical protein
VTIKELAKFARVSIALKDRQLLRQTILINFYDELLVFSHKKCRQHFDCAGGGKLYIMSGQFALKKCL